MKKVQFFETSGINNPATKRSNQEEMNIQYKTSNLKPVFYTVFIGQLFRVLIVQQFRF